MGADVDEGADTVTGDEIDHGDDDGLDLATGVVTEGFHIETEAVMDIFFHGG